MRHVWRNTIALVLAVLGLGLVSGCKPSIIALGKSGLASLPGSSAPDGMTVTGITASPADGPIAAGTKLTITGSGFAGDLQVSVNGVSCSPVTIVATTELNCVATATIPAGGPIIIISLAGSSGSSGGSSGGGSASASSPAPAPGPAPGPAPPANLPPTFSGLRCPKAVEGVAYNATFCTFTTLSDDGGVAGLTIAKATGTTCSFLTSAAKNGTYKADLTGSAPAGGTAGTTCDVALAISDGTNTVTATSNITIGAVKTVGAGGFLADLSIDDATDVTAVQNNAVVVPTGTTLTIKVDQQIPIASLDVQGTGQVTHYGCTTTACKSVNFKVDGWASVATGASIQADGKGYLGGWMSGPDAAQNGSKYGRTVGNSTTGGSYEYYSGGSHGGRGGDAGGFNQVGWVFGNLRQPHDPGGGGGGYDVSQISGAGGGVVIVDVLNTLTLNGTVSVAGGAPSSGANGSGGAGGSIWLSAGTLATTAGSPVIRANGHPGGSAGRGGGAGGRIAIYYDALSGFTVSRTTVQAFAGTHPGGLHGGAGTVFTKAASEASGKLIIDNNNLTPSLESIYDLSFYSTSVTTNTISVSSVLLPAGELVGKTLRPNLESASTCSITGNTTNAITVSGCDLTTLTTVGTYGGVTDFSNQYDSVEIKGAAKAVASKFVVTNATTTSVFSVADAGTYLVTHYPNLTGTAPLEITADNISIAPSTSISGAGRGYLGGYSLGANGVENTNTSGLSVGNSTVGGAGNYTSGGSHGGVGARSNTAVAGKTYGNYLQPTLPGGGGGGLNASQRAGLGGGVIRLIANNAITLNGTVSVDGGAGSPTYSGGAGGSIWITTQTLASSGGTPLITANGHPGTGAYSGGGGGRIAIYYSSFSGLTPSRTTVKAFGGDNPGSAFDGAAGTVYLKSAAQSYGSLWIDNNGLVPYNETVYDQSGYASALTATVLTSGTAFFPDGALVGKTLRPNVEKSATCTIASNTKNTITVSGCDLTTLTAVGKFFQVTDFATQLDTLEVKGAAHAIAQKFNLTNGSTAGSLIVTETGSYLTAHPATTTGFAPLEITADRVEVHPGASVSGTARGYVGGYNTGADGVQHSSKYGQTIDSSTVGGSYEYLSGGSHGGTGGAASAITYVGRTFDNLYQPALPGAGGGAYDPSQISGNGGGVVRIIANDRVVINGSIVADGGVPPSANGTGGAGGSVWITAPTLESTGGSPLISANGRAATGGRGAGGGGRVALYYTTLTGIAISRSTVQAFGGNSTDTIDADAGTVYTKTPSQTYGSLIVDNNDVIPTTETTYDLSGYVGGVSASTLTLAANSSGGTIFLPENALGGKLLRPNVENSTTCSIASNTKDTVTVTGCDLTTLSAAGKYFSVSDAFNQFDSIVFAGATYGRFSKLVAQNAGLTGSFQIYSPNTTLFTPYTTLVGYAPLEIAANTLSIGVNTSVVSDGRGYLGGYGRSAIDSTTNTGKFGRTDGNSNTGGSWEYLSGGSHGGRGGNAGGGVVAAAYDSYTQPVQPGGGGGGYDVGQYAGNGGGVIRISTTGTFTLDGTLSSNGTGGASGGGAGGSIWIDAGTLATTGTPVIRATGSDGGAAGRGGGGGGRIAVYYGALSGFAFNATTVQARGANSATASCDGSAGSIYYKLNSDSNGSYRCDNTGVNSAAYNSPITFTSNTTWKDLTSANGCALYMNNNGNSLTVTGTSAIGTASGSMQAPTGLFSLTGSGDAPTLY